MPVTDYGAGADTSRFLLSYVEESAWGTTPTAALTDLRVTGESMNLTEGSVTSEEIRSDRQITDLIRTSFEATGGLNFELSYGEFDPMFKAALMGAFTANHAPGALTVTIADGAGSNDSTITDDGTGGVLGASPLAVGMWVQVSGLTTNAAENGFYLVTAVNSTDQITVEPRLTAVAAEASVTIANDGHVQNGTTVSSFTFEKSFADVTQFFSLTGMVPNTMSLEFNSESILTGSFDFLGKSGARAGSTVGTGPNVASQTNRVLNAVNNVGSIRENGSAIGTEATYFVQSMSVNLDNALRGQKAIGDAGNVGIGLGRATVTGSLSVYFVDGALYDRFVNETETSIDWRVTDTAGNSYIFTLPRVKLSNAQVVAGGTDQDVLATFDFQALRDATYGFTMGLDRFAV